MEDRRLTAVYRNSIRRRRLMAKEDVAPSKEKLVDIPYESRTFRKPGSGEEVTVKGFRERLEEAYKTYDANNKAVMKQTADALKKYQDTISALNEATNYDIKALVAEVNKAKETNQEVFEAIGQISSALQMMAQSYPDVDETTNQIIIGMMDELVGVGALNASNEVLKTMAEYLAEYDQITVNFYRVIGGGKEKGERTREYFTVKKTKKIKTINAGTAYKQALLRLNNQLLGIFESAQDAGAELVKFAKEVNDVVALWSLYLEIVKKRPSQKEPAPKMIWKGREMTEEDIKAALMKYAFYREIATDLSFRKTEEVPSATEVKLHALRAMIRKIRAEMDSIINAPAYAAGAMQEYADICSAFIKDAAAGLRKITAEIYGGELAEEEGKGFMDKVRDFAGDMVPEPMLAGAAARKRVLAKRVIAERHPQQEKVRKEKRWKGIAPGDIVRRKGDAGGREYEVQFWGGGGYIGKVLMLRRMPDGTLGTHMYVSEPEQLEQASGTIAADGRRHVKAAGIEIDGSSLRDSDVSYFEMGSDQTLAGAALNDHASRADIAYEAITNGKSELIDWNECERYHRLIFTDGFFFRPGEGLFFKENSDSEVKLIFKAATVKEVFEGLRKERFYVEYDSAELPFDGNAVDQFLFDSGWRVFVEEGGDDRYAIKLY